ncbi:MAG: class I SAM-dependent methyltransferase [Candidatus Aureabacteria bacterium]|nr:class I SAM-dependent methyltransferase [Candidatus Auribacterota bacterium]
MEHIMSTRSSHRMPEILLHYHGLPLAARLHNKIRYLTCPFDRIEPLVPAAGSIYDLGCGHGLFSLYLALTSARRTVIGCDISEDKISIARQAARNIHNVEFRHVDILNFALLPAEAILLIDVLYLFSPGDQDRIIGACYTNLKPGGLLLVKTTDTSPRWKYAWAYAQEVLAVKILGITNGQRVQFRSQEEFAKIFSALHLHVHVERIDNGYLHPHILYVCRKEGINAPPVDRTTSVSAT